jgi:hypothetical protein
VRVYGRGSINNLTGHVVVIERLPHEVDIFGEGLAGALCHILAHLAKY